MRSELLRHPASLALAETLNQQTIAAQQEEISSLRDECAQYRNSVQGAVSVVMAAIVEAEWIVVGDRLSTRPTLYHLLRDGYVDWCDTSDDERQQIRKQIATTLGNLAAGARKLTLTCWKCTLSKSRCSCCSDHRLDTEERSDCHACARGAERE